MRPGAMLVGGLLVCAQAGCRSGHWQPVRPRATGGSEGDASAGGGSAGASGNGAGGAGGAGGATSAGTGFLIEGTLVTPDESFTGEVLVEGDQIICAAQGSACESKPGASGATVVKTSGIIAPGLIDTHNHILFDIFDESDWKPNLPSTCASPADCQASPYCTGTKCDCVGGVCRYTNHNQWPKEVEYQLMLDYKQCLEDASQGKPVWCPEKYDGAGSLRCEMDKFGELKGLIAGTTSIVGLPGISARCFGSLSRSIDVAENGLGSDKIQTSALFPPSSSSADGVCANFASGKTDAYLIHCGEGVDAAALNEWTTLSTITSTDGCLIGPGTTITHGTAFGAAEFSAMAQAGVKLTWSPASNVALYGKTTDIPAALSAGVLVSLAPDWSMGGSQNILDEMRFANAWDDAHFGNLLSPKDLVLMTTKNAAAVLHLGSELGQLKPGFKADLFIVDGNPTTPYDAIVAATPADVELVMVGGRVLYGDASRQALGPAKPGCENLTVCGKDKFLCAAEADSADKLNQTYSQIHDALDNALVDLDNIQPLDPSQCSPACAAGQECYARTDYPRVADSDCSPACVAGEACFQTAQSGTKRCLSVSGCVPARNHKFAPLTPLVKCP